MITTVFDNLAAPPCAKLLGGHLLDARTQERDTKAQGLKQFAQELQALLGRMDSTIAAGQRPVGPTVAVPVSRRQE